MQLIKSLNLINDLKENYLFFDTNVLVGLIEYPHIFSELLRELVQNNCAFLTIPQVQFEFTRGSGTVERYNARIKFLNDFKFSIYPIDQHAKSYPELILMLHKVSKGISYTDYLLCLCMCKFTSAYLISEDRDIPIALFDRKHVVTVDTDKDLRSYGIYASSIEKMESIAAEIV